MAITYTPENTVTVRRDATCLHGEILGAGVPVVAVPHPKSKGKRGYICLDDWAKRYTVAEVNAIRFNPENLSDDEIEYSVAVKCSKNCIEEVLPLLLFTNKGRIAQWLPTADGFASPTYGDVHFHGRLLALGEKLPRATVTVTLKRHGVKLDTVTATWVTRDGMGRFASIKSEHQGELDGFELLDAIDEAAKPWRYQWVHRNRKTADDIR